MNFLSNQYYIVDLVCLLLGFSEINLIGYKINVTLELEIRENM